MVEAPVTKGLSVVGTTYDSGGCRLAPGVREFVGAIRDDVLHDAGDRESPRERDDAGSGERER